MNLKYIYSLIKYGRWYYGFTWNYDWKFSYENFYYDGEHRMFYLGLFWIEHYH